MKNILVVCPTHRDLRELNKKNFSLDNRIIFYGDDAHKHLDSFNAIGFINEVLKKFGNKSIDGVAYSDDYPGCIIASIIAKKLGLPHAEPEKILLCQHKYYSRKAQVKSVPNAVPKFVLVDPYAKAKEIGLDFPFFIKPVKSFISIFAFKVNNRAELDRILESAKLHLPKFVKPFNQLLEKYANFGLNADYLLAEELLEGHQVTVEGFVCKNNIEIIGIVDSIMFPDTISFERFEYPSKLSKGIQQRMIKIAKKFISSIGFNNGIFNIEMIYNHKNDKIGIIEVNPRMCSQFADMMEKVHGTNTYDIQLKLSLGLKPNFKKNAGKYDYANSFVLRTFEDKKIVKLPAKRQIEKIEKRFPDARIEVFGKEGSFLSDELQDGKSYRYGLINLGGENKEDLFRKYEECKKYLKFKFNTKIL